MAIKQADGKWKSNSGQVFDDHGTAANADKAYAASSKGNASEALIEGAGAIFSGIGSAIENAIDAQLDKAKYKAYLERGGAEYIEANNAEKRGDYYAAINLYKKAFDKGVDNTQERGSLSTLYDIAECYRDGLKNDVEAFNYFKKAADKSDHRAYYHTAVCYRDGIGTTKDDEKAFEYFKKSADDEPQVDFDSILAVGLSYRDGIGVEKNTDLAIKYLSILDRDRSLASRYASSNSKDRSEQDLLMVIEMGKVFNHLAICYRDGGPGVEPDDNQAIRYFKRAAENKNKEAVANLAEMGIKYSATAEGANTFLSWLCGIVCAIGITLFVNWVYVLITGADKLPLIASLLSIVIFGVIAFNATRNRNKITLILLALAVFGWLYLFDIIPEPKRASSTQIEQTEIE